MKKIVTADDVGIRLDQFLVKTDTSKSRSFFKKLIEQEHVIINGHKAKVSHHLVEGEEISWSFPKPKKLGLEPEDIPLTIIHEDDSIIVIDKPAGLVVHPGAGHETGTLVHALLARRGTLSSIGGVERPGIVHRLDKGTSGVIVVAKTDQAHQSLSEQFKDHRIKKEYTALVKGHFIPKEGTIKNSIGRHLVDRKKMSSKTKQGREAITHYKVTKEFAEFSLVSCFPQTGRTHQIRVHMAEAGHPIAGDELYGSKVKLEGLDRTFLHASTLTLFHPKDNREITFKSELSKDLKTVIESSNLS